MSESTPEPTNPEESIREEQPKKAEKAAEAPVEIRTGLRPRSAKRLAIMAVILIALIYGFNWFVSQKGDIFFPSDTSKMIGALKLDEAGAQAVVVDTEGKVTQSSGYTAGKSDRDLAWDPKGNRLFFISDRKEDSFHIFRWDPQRNGNPDQKSIDRASRGDLVFDVQDKGTEELMGLVIVRGTVQEFTPRTAKSQQVMPPTKRGLGSGDPEGGGQTGNFEQIYKRFGQSFKSARWFFNRRYIAAVMSREDKGESLIVQDTIPDDKGNIRPPQLLFIAEKIAITVDPKSGGLVFAVTEVLPQLGNDGKPVVGEDGKPQVYPFSHALFRMVEKDNALAIEFIGPSPSKEFCLASPVVSPDGNSVMFLAGKYLGDGNMEVQSLVSCPLTQGGIKGGTPIVSGNITDPSFSPDGKKIAYIKQEGGHQAIFVANSDGGDAKNLTGSSGDFATPVFSPQYK